MGKYAIEGGIFTLMHNFHDKTFVISPNPRFLMVIIQGIFHLYIKQKILHHKTLYTF